MNQPITGAVSATLSAAFKRAVILAAISGALVALTTRQQDIGGVSPSWEDALVAGAIAALGILITRGLGEGSLDAQRQAEGNVSAADVQPNPVAPPRPGV